MENDKFWFVWVEGKNLPVVKHSNKTSAVAEAGRLFKNMAKRAYVLEVVGYHDSTGSAYHDSIATIKAGAQ